MKYNLGSVFSAQFCRKYFPFFKLPQFSESVFCILKSIDFSISIFLNQDCFHDIVNLFSAKYNSVYFKQSIKPDLIGIKFELRKVFIEIVQVKPVKDQGLEKEGEKIISRTKESIITLICQLLSLCRLLPKFFVCYLYCPGDWRTTTINLPAYPLQRFLYCIPLHTIWQD